jgi:hypothetical protein
LVDRLGTLYRRWTDDVEIDASDDDLANAASIRRWEAAALRDRAQAIDPPPTLAREHEELVALAGATARAAQLLSNGYRFHSSSARCDGQALMMESEARHATLRRHLELLGVSFPAAADADAARRP